MCFFGEGKKDSRKRKKEGGRKGNRFSLLNEKKEKNRGEGKGSSGWKKRDEVLIHC